MILQLISELAYYLVFSIIISITLLGTIMHYRTKDRIIWHFLGVLYMQSLLFLIGFLFHYINSTGYAEIIQTQSDNLGLFGIIFVCFVITAVIYLTIKYTLFILPLDEKQYRLGKTVTAVICAVLLIVVLFFLIILADGSWAEEAVENLMKLFEAGSLLLTVPAVLALVYLRKTKVKGNRQLLKGIAVSFFPMGFYFAIDMLFLQESAFRMIHIAYAVFAVSVYMYLTKHYTINYEPEAKEVLPRVEQFYREYNISERETDIIDGLVVGKTNKEIAADLYISINTVKTHIKNIYRKLNVKNRIQLIHKIKVTGSGNPEG